MFVGFGVSYSFGAFFASLEREFAARRGDLSIVFAIASALYFALGLASGPAADRWGARRVGGAGMLVMAAGLAASSRADALWQIYLAFGVSVGIGVGFTYVPSLGAVQPWFVRRRAFATGIAVAGIGGGTLALPPTAALLVEAFGWRGACLGLALVTLAIGGGACLLLDGRPQRRGFGPDGAAAAAAGGRAQAGTDFATAWRSRPFRLLTLISLLTSFGVFVPFVHLAPSAIDQGVPDGIAAALIGVIGLGSLVGRFAVGAVADRFGRRRTLPAVVVAQAVLLAFWMVADRLWMLGAFALAFGLSYGGYVALLPTMCTDYFGARSIGAIMGAVFSGVSVGCLLGPPLAGFAFDATGSYAWPIAACVAFTTAGAFAAAGLPDPARWQEAAR
ncbi:MAG: MFS transporter [Alphaproteobacteria bacterium]|nr:MFS transporter [Alphaproteobacteria bacterium]